MNMSNGLTKTGRRSILMSTNMAEDMVIVVRDGYHTFVAGVFCRVPEQPK